MSDTSQKAHAPCEANTNQQNFLLIFRSDLVSAGWAGCMIAAVELPDPGFGCVKLVLQARETWDSVAISA